MKLAFIIPVLEEIELTETVRKINEGCDMDYDIYFAINGKLNSFFTKVRTTYLDNAKVKAFMVDRPVNEHKLITLGMEMTADYDATIIYSAKEEPNVDVIKAFISSWKAGNKIVYLKKEYSGFKKLWAKIKRAFYSLGIKALGIFKDQLAETDIQLIDQDVVKTINQLPQKNRQLRVQDSFVGYATDIIQIEIDNKMKENKLYYEKIKAQKVCGIVSLSSLVTSIICLTMGFIAASLGWAMSIVIYVLLFSVGFCGLVLTFVYATKMVLHSRVGQETELSELNDLRNKLEKYNISNKK
ncbi:MAG: hypothetical protein E7354_04925 [Clostridiales bacterium]|nr:hypothetical protein [Clostridiales bacterium]